MGNKEKECILIRRPAVETITGLKRSSIYAKMNPTSKQYDSCFPKPICLSVTGKGSVAWVLEEVKEWVSHCIVKSRVAE
ncbi:AlpA family phage regulatory protein [Glaciimonas sp. PCH181]|uniref:AlpA family phage regulatory protein n=1 Tax=Glaciimonas sp. PCH181 TaxID=2133943 RepID=UPI000D38F08D|nr:AlpA family phage regulatory protein [Glaciimonas sp. PCH181]PUA20715.1 hypothetical protein C7W93_04725 [Glaciimonas sp. PCH181]